MSNAKMKIIPVLACPCGHEIPLLDRSGWAMVRDRDFQTLVTLEIRLREYSKKEKIKPLTKTQFQAWKKLNWKICELVQSLRECPRCKRVLRHSIEHGHQSYVPERARPKIKAGSAKRR